MRKPILLMGLPGAGKTTLAKCLAPRIGAVHFNNDDVRANVGRDLDFSMASRIEQARRMRWLCDQVARAGHAAIADFICPTAATREAFGDCFLVWVDRISKSRYPDTDALFEAPDRFDVRVEPDGTPEFWAEAVAKAYLPVFDPRKPTALFVGRYQPFHAGHQALIEQGLERVGQVCIAVRDVYATGNENPLKFEDVKQRIEAAMSAHRGRFVVVPLPNITHVFYGRNVGYAIERIELDDALHGISATEARRRARLRLASS
ncbi:MAG TPA: adenylyl-sulfate kinase [Terriglobales bacterium]|nr:adenylyl-sulfate kinase [Terriglobales bacterium]